MFTTDTRKSHCPIRIMYAPETFTEDGVAYLKRSMHSADLRDKPDARGTSWNCRWPMAIIKATEHSDYTGNAVEQSNYRMMLANEDMQPHLVEIYGSHGYRALAYDATLGPYPESWELANALDGFENHDSIFDDDDHSALESELETEAWDDHGRQDFRKALIPVFDALDDDGGAEAGYEHELPDDDAPYALGIVFDANVCSDAETWQTALWDLWHAGCDALNVNGGSGFVVKTGSTVHFYIADWCAKAGADVHYPTNRPIHDALRELAKACRSGA